jgi:hypothetical protein
VKLLENITGTVYNGSILGAVTNQALIPNDIAVRYEVHEWRNGLEILSTAHPDEWRNILEVLRDFALLRSDVLKRGGSKGLIAQKLDSHFTRLGWIEKAFDTRIVVDKSEFAAPTHKVDCYKNRGGARSRMEQQRPVLRPGPEQFSSVVRSARNRRWRNHHSMQRAAADFQAAGKGEKLW